MSAAPSSNTLSGPLVLGGMILLAALSRLLPHPPNFSPIEAVALFSGALLVDRRLAMLVPLAAMALSDAIIGFHDGLPLVYACIAAIALAGHALLHARRRPLRIALTGFGATLFFFLVTNGALWITAGTEFCAAGLTACYVAALPFFQNQLAGVAFYGLLLFGGWALLERRVDALAPTR